MGNKEQTMSELRQYMKESRLGSKNVQTYTKCVETDTMYGPYSVGDIVFCVYHGESVENNFIIRSILTKPGLCIVSVSFPGEDEEYLVGHGLIRRARSLAHLAIAKVKERRRE